MTYPSEPEFLTAEELAERLHVCRATVYAWKQKGILAQGRDYLKQRRVVRYIWGAGLIQRLLGASAEAEKKRSAAEPSAIRIQQNKSMPINWDY